MKKLIALLLALSLLLAGCGAEETQEETAPKETTAVTETFAEEIPETAPDETIPQETVPAQTIPEETAPAETIPEETVPAETIPEETAPAQTKPQETKPAANNTKPQETKPTTNQTTNNTKPTTNQTAISSKPSTDSPVTSEKEETTPSNKHPGEEIAILTVYMRLRVGQSELIHYATTGTHIWKSSDPSIATIDQNGKVTGIAPGEVTISLTDGVTTDTCTIYISGTDHRLWISDTNPVFVGVPRMLAYSYEGTDLYPLTWQSADPSILTFDEKGQAIGVSQGKAKVTVSDGDVHYTANVLVLPQEYQSKEVLLTHTEERLYDGSVHFAGELMRIKMIARPDYFGEVKGFSSDESVVKVSIELSPQYTSRPHTVFRIEFLRAGTATLTFQSYDGSVSVSYCITVKGDYDCNPGKTRLTPGEFSYYATQVGVEKGQTASHMLSGYRWLYLEDAKLTWEVAREIGVSLAKEWYSIGIERILVTYEGWDEEKQMHLFYVGY